MKNIPTDVLVMVLERMDTRTMARASTACRAFHTAAQAVRALRPILRPHDAAGQLLWALDPARRERVTTIHGVRLGHGTPWSLLAGLPKLQSLSVCLSRVPHTLFRHLGDSLLNVDIHRLDPGINDVFSTRQLARFPSLRRAHITFAPGWALAVVGPCADSLPHLHTLQLRRIPAIAVTSSMPSLHHVSLHALDVMAGRVPVAPNALSVALHCDETPLDDLPNLVHPTVRDLTVLARGSPESDSFFPSLTHLKSLHLGYDVLPVPDLRSLERLTRLQLDAGACLVFDTHSAVPSTLAMLQATSQRRPMDIQTYLDVAAQTRASRRSRQAGQADTTGSQADTPSIL
jgi:hypothetical protein